MNAEAQARLDAVLNSPPTGRSRHAQTIDLARQHNAPEDGITKAAVAEVEAVDEIGTFGMPATPAIQALRADEGAGQDSNLRLTDYECLICRHLAQPSGSLVGRWSYLAVDLPSWEHVGNTA